MQVVGEEAVEADVGVNDEGQCQGAVEDGRGAVLGEPGGNERDEGHGKTTFKRPVVGAVCCVGLGEWGWVVDGALDVSCKRASVGREGKTSVMLES